MFVNHYYERIRHHVQEPLKYFQSTSPRKLLFSINFFVAAYSICLSSFSLFLSSLLYDPGFATGWIVWLGLAVVGICLAITCIIGMRGAHLVSLDLLLTYFWGIIVFIGPLVLGTVAAIQFYLFMETWFYHEWPLVTFAKMRALFCPDNTANEKCMGPLTNGNDDGTVLQWCMSNFNNATDCQVSPKLLHSNYNKDIYDTLLVLHDPLVHPQWRHVYRCQSFQSTHAGSSLSVCL